LEKQSGLTVENKKSYNENTKRLIYYETPVTKSSVLMKMCFVTLKKDYLKIVREKQGFELFFSTSQEQVFIIINWFHVLNHSSIKKVSLRMLGVFVFFNKVVLK
jgi:hypothetical protein